MTLVKTLVFEELKGNFGGVDYYLKLKKPIEVDIYRKIEFDSSADDEKHPLEYYATECTCCSFIESTFMSDGTEDEIENELIYMASWVYTVFVATPLSQLSSDAIQDTLEFLEYFPEEALQYHLDMMNLIEEDI